MSPGRSATTPTISWVASWIVKPTLVLTIVSSPVDERDLELAAEGRRLGVEEERLVGLGRQVDDLPEPGPALGAAGQPQLAR